jgi:hypothetical protein
MEIELSGNVVSVSVCWVLIIVEESLSGPLVVRFVGAYVRVEASRFCEATVTEGSKIDLCIRWLLG